MTSSMVLLDDSPRQRPGEPDSFAVRQPSVAAFRTVRHSHPLAHRPGQGNPDRTGASVLG